MIKPWIEKLIKNEVVLLDNISGVFVVVITPNTHVGNEYAKCLEFKLGYFQMSCFLIYARRS